MEVESQSANKYLTEGTLYDKDEHIQIIMWEELTDSIKVNCFALITYVCIPGNCKIFRLMCYMLI